MTFEEYCIENGLNYTKIFNYIKKTFKEKDDNTYILGSIFFKNKDNSTGMHDQYEYNLIININEYKVSINELQIDTRLDAYPSTKIYNSIQEAILEFKKILEVANKKLILDTKNTISYDEILIIINKIINLTKEDKAINIFKDIINFVDNELANVCLKNDLKLFPTNNHHWAFYANNDILKLHISILSVKDSKYYGTPKFYIYNYANINIYCKIVKEDLTLEKTFNTLDELKQILRKIAHLIDNNVFYTNLNRDLLNLVE